MNALRIYFRQHQLQDINNDNQNVVVICGDIASYVPGNADPTWTEMTNFAEGLEKFQSSWDAVNQGDSKSSATNESGSNYDKGITLSLTFFDVAFNYIWDWLLTTKCQILNAIDVRIDDVICGKSYRLFEIKCDNLTYKPFLTDYENGVKSCRIDVQLREQDLIWHCVHKTFIWDDWNGFATTKDHPTFLTCIEPRPRIMNSVRMAFLLLYQSMPVVNILTGNINDATRRILDLQFFVPAPLIRDYIDNVAGKCGLAVDTIFHRTGTPEYYACIYHPLSGQMYENDDVTERSPSTKFIFENRWDLSLADFLDRLKLVYACEWYVTPNNTIVFKPTTELIQLSPIYDFTIGDLPIRNLEYTFDGTKKPAYGRYQYSVDGSDLGSQEISPLYNDLTDFDGPSNNPMMEGELDEEFEFASTAFVRDGMTKDYIKLLINDGKVVSLIITAAMGVVTAALVGGALTAVAAVLLALYVGWWEISIATNAGALLNEFADEESSYTGAVRLVTANQTMTPRILYWDAVDIDRAKVIKVIDPDANSYYNPTAIPYTTSNDISKDNPDNNVFNYLAYFDSMYTGNMFDRFHDNLDNPLKSLETNQSFEFDTDMCCEALDLFGLWNGDFIKIGYLLVLERRTNYTVYGRIQHIDINYATYTIKIKGIVLKNLAFLPPNPVPAPSPVTGFDFEYGYTDLDTTGATPTEAEYVASVDSGIVNTASEPDTGDNITVNSFGNTSDKVLFIQIPTTEADFTLWSEVGNALQQNQPIDSSFTGSNVWFKSLHSGETIYLTRSQTTFAGAVILSR